MMKKIKKIVFTIILLGLILVGWFICQEKSYGYGIVNNSGTLPADSLSIPFFALDSSGNVVAMASGDSVFLYTFYPSGALAFEDSLAYDGAKITAKTAHGFSVYTWKDLVANLDGTAEQGVYSYILTVKDKTSASLQTPHKGTFQLLTESDFNLSIEYIKDALDTLQNQDNWVGTVANQTLVKDTINAVLDTLQLYDGRWSLATELTKAIDTTNAVLDTLQNQDNWIAKEASLLTKANVADTVKNTPLQLTVAERGHIEDSIYANRADYKADVSALALQTEVANINAWNPSTDSTNVKGLTSTKLGYLDVAISTRLAKADTTEPASYLRTKTMDSNVIGANQIAAAAIGATEFAISAIGADAIAADAIGASEIAAGALTSESLAYVAYVADIRNNDTTYSSNAGTGLDSATTSRIVKRTVWGVGTGSDSTTIAQRKVGYADDIRNNDTTYSSNAGTGLDSATTSRVIKRTVWGIGTGSDSSTQAQRRIQYADSLGEAISATADTASIARSVWDNDVIAQSGRRIQYVDSLGETITASTDTSQIKTMMTNNSFAQTGTDKIWRLRGLHLKGTVSNDTGFSVLGGEGAWATYFKGGIDGGALYLDGGGAEAIRMNAGGNAVLIEAVESGVYIATSGANCPGFYVKGGPNASGFEVIGQGTGSGIKATKGTTGYDIDADIHGTIDTVTYVKASGTGIGTNVCSLWVYTTSDSQAVSNMSVSVLNNAMTSTIALNTTNNNGMAFVKLSDGTYKVITELAGYSQVNSYDTFTVSGVSQDTIWVDEYDPGTPTNPLKCRVYDCAYDFTGNKLAGGKVVITANQSPVRDSTGAFKVATYEQTARANSSGEWYMDIYRSGALQYKQAGTWKAGVTFNVRVFAPNGEKVYELTNFTVPDQIQWQLP